MIAPMIAAAGIMGAAGLGSAALSAFGSNRGSSSQQVTSLPAYMRDASGHAVAIAKDKATSSVVPWDWDRRVAPLTSGYTQAANMAKGNPYQQYQGSVGTGIYGLQSAGGAYGRPNSYLGQLSRGQATNTTSWPSQQNREQYMSPYIRGALDPVAREMRRSSEFERLRNETGARNSGAFGGTREALLESERRRNLNQNVSDMYAGGLQNAYESGMGAYQLDASRSLESQKANAAAGMNMFVQGQGAYKGLGNMATQGGNLTTAQLQQLTNTSAPLQAHQQSKWDANTLEFNRTQNYYDDAIKTYQAATSLPHEGINMANTHYPSNPLAAGLGGAFAGAGIANQMGLFGGAYSPQQPAMGPVNAGGIDINVPWYMRESGWAGGRGSGGGGAYDAQSWLMNPA